MGLGRRESTDGLERGKEVVDIELLWEEERIVRVARGSWDQLSAKRLEAMDGGWRMRVRVWLLGDGRDREDAGKRLLIILSAQGCKAGSLRPTLSGTMQTELVRKLHFLAALGLALSKRRLLEAPEPFIKRV